ncbi:hypothetical protein Ocin01_00765 [Orchesella cincta]|uniref:F-box domain-containing protein n=1 Tax=Orchesella cincta TaxID=48709 RepID=A0A1D2NKW8_ORCCI|nr:hypothetical protein Ocin01_00765 [Orchesella cincta]
MESAVDDCKCSDLEGQEDDSEQDEERHPLLNSVILRNIFRHCGVKDLKKLRLVCTLWYELASPYLQQESKVVLQEELFREETSIKKFLNYVDELEDTDKIFCRNFKISLLTVARNNDMIVKFWEKVGPSINSLEMSLCRFMGVDMVRNVMFKWTPNLKRFCLRDCTFYKEKDGCCIVENELAETDYSVPVNRNLISLEFYGGESRVGPPLTWMEVITAFPNLKQLLLYNLNPKGVTDLLTEMGKIRKKDTSKLNIEKLNIFNGDFAFGQLTGPTAQLLMDLKLPITNLNMDVGMNTSDLIMASILKTYCNTLRHLTMYRGPFAIPFVKFPFDITFPELITLELAESITDDFNFVLFTPKLQKLSICESPDSEPPILPTDMITNTEPVFKNASPIHLHQLRLDYDCTLGDVRKLVRWFPEIKSLRMYLDNESFRLICGEWKDLEELEILGDKVTDEGITGLSLTSNSSQYVLTKNSLSIRSLQSLRVFIMKNYGMSTSISDLSVNHGFLLMHRLNHLELCSGLITDEGWKHLRAMTSLSVLRPSDGAWESQCSSFSKG